MKDEAYTKSFGYEWNVFNKTQLDSHTNTSISKDRWESITNYKVDELDSKRILEVGCGSGRFLEVLAPYAKQLVGHFEFQDWGDDNPCSISFGALAKNKKHRQEVVSRLVENGIETRIFSAVNL